MQYSMILRTPKCRYNDEGGPGGSGWVEVGQMDQVIQTTTFVIHNSSNLTKKPTEISYSLVRTQKHIFISNKWSAYSVIECNIIYQFRKKTLLQTAKSLFL